MKTLQAQRLKKQAEHEYNHHQALMEQIFAAAEAEAGKLEGLLSSYRDLSFKEESKQIAEEYREEDDLVYFEEGFLER